MAEDRVERRLAAILAADVAGYSRLMGADEEGTLAALKAHRRAVLDPKITEHRGRIVKTTGDGLLVEFASVVDAVRCAVDMQREMAERNAGVAAEQRIEFRIGLNVGDIIIDDKDIYGDLSQREPKKSAEQAQARKKGKVIQVHGPDVFVDVPGGRSQGVLPLMQFPDGPPAPGTEVENRAVVSLWFALNRKLDG